MAPRQHQSKSWMSVQASSASLYRTDPSAADECRIQTTSVVAIARLTAPRLWPRSATYSVSLLRIKTSELPSVSVVSVAPSHSPSTMTPSIAGAACSGTGSVRSGDGGAVVVEGSVVVVVVVVVAPVVAGAVLVVVGAVVLVAMVVSAELHEMTKTAAAQSVITSRDLVGPIIASRAMGPRCLVG